MMMHSRKFITLILVAVSLCGGQSYADSWVLGSISGSSNNPARNLPPQYLPPWTLPIQDGGGSSVNNYNGNWTVTYNWSGNYPPSTSYWLETVNAMVGGTGTGATITTTPTVPQINGFFPVAPGSSTIAGNLIASGGVLSQHSGGTVTFSPQCSATLPNLGGQSSYTYNVVPAFTINVPSSVYIGQQVSPTIGAIPAGYQIVPGSYTWAVTGNTFTGYTPGIAISSGINGTFSSNPNWYWYGTGNGQTVQDTIGCSFTVTTPSGSTQQITEQSTVSVVELQWNMTGIPGYVCIYSTGSGNYSDRAIGLTNTPHGMTWIGSAGLGPVSAGQWGICQTVQGLEGMDFEEGDSILKANGVALDNSYPYGVWSADGTTDNLTPLDTIGDSPGVNFPTTAISAFINFSFNDNLMFQPTGANSNWVPLGTFAWSVQSYQIIPDYGNQAPPFASWSLWPYNGVSGSITGGGSFTDNSSAFPIWQSVLTNQ